MFSIKPGASIRGIRQETVVGLMIANFVFTKHGIEFVLTEGTGGKHSEGSLHYVGLAGDIRTSNIPRELLEKIRDEIREALGAEFDFILEVDHFHLEFQPKGPQSNK